MIFIEFWNTNSQGLNFHLGIVRIIFPKRSSVSLHHNLYPIVFYSIKNSVHFEKVQITQKSSHAVCVILINYFLPQAYHKNI